MELDILVVVLRHLEDVAAICHKDIATLFVLRHILGFAFLEHLQFLFVIGLYPAGLEHLQWLPTAFGLVLMLQAVLDNFKLQLSYRADNLAAIELADKQLCYTFVHELANALVKLLLLHWVGILDILKHLRREGWQTLEVEVLACGEGVTNLEIACIWKTYYIACKSFVHGLFALRHEAGRR